MHTIPHDDGFMLLDGDTVRVVICCQPSEKDLKRWERIYNEEEMALIRNTVKELWK